MKKYWKFLSVWMLLVLLVNINALSYYGDYIGIPYIIWIAETWILLDVLLVVAVCVYFAWHLVPRFRDLTGKIFTHAVREYLRPDKRKLMVFVGMVVASFLIGILCTLIKSTNHEGAFAISFWILAPEFTFPGWFKYEWMDTAFGMATLGMMLGKWIVLYLASSFVARKAQ